MTSKPKDGPTSPLIRIEGLCKVFHTDDIETHALDRITLQIDRGDFIAITGPSGCGKSTLLSILGMLDTPNAGEYYLKGQDVATLARRERAIIRNREIGFIFQAFNLISDLSVHDNVELPLTYRDGMEKATRRRRVRDALELVGMSHRTRHYPSQLSGGQQQRVAVARALAGEPAILLADEPTGNLDTRNGEAVMKLLEDLHAAGSTLCMVTHDLAFAHRSTRIVHMLDGNIVDEDAYERLRYERAIPMSLAKAE